MCGFILVHHFAEHRVIFLWGYSVPNPTCTVPNISPVPVCSQKSKPPRLLGSAPLPPPRATTEQFHRFTAMVPKYTFSLYPLPLWFLISLYLVYLLIYSFVYSTVFIKYLLWVRHLLKVVSRWICFCLDGAHKSSRENRQYGITSARAISGARFLPQLYPFHPP